MKSRADRFCSSLGLVESSKNKWLKPLCVNESQQVAAIMLRITRLLKQLAKSFPDSVLGQSGRSQKGMLPCHFQSNLATSRNWGSLYNVLKVWAPGSDRKLMSSPVLHL